jgi:hypothetical protein
MARHISLSNIKPSRHHAKLVGVGWTNHHFVLSDLGPYFKEIFRDHILRTRSNFQSTSSWKPYLATANRICSLFSEAIIMFMLNMLE